MRTLLLALVVFLGGCASTPPDGQARPGVQTDTDNTGDAVEAFYGAIVLKPASQDCPPRTRFDWLPSVYA